jgi:DNA-binding transcriptional LysR family regulator
MTPRVTLEQWRALVAVVEANGYARAAEVLHKTQSTLSYGVQKLEQQLGVKVFEIRGRKARLTDAGQVLYRRGKLLLEEAARLERTAAALASGYEAELRLAVETIFPTWLLLQCLEAFAHGAPDTRIELYETVLGGTEEALIERKVDLAITSWAPPGFLGDHLATLRFVAAAAPFHPLHRLGRPLTLDDLRQHRQLVIRDSGARRLRSAGWLGAEQRWTVSTKATSIRAAVMGLGFAWYAESNIREELRSGQLEPLPLVDGAERVGSLQLVYADPDSAGPGARRLGGLLRDALRAGCIDADLYPEGLPPPELIPHRPAQT